MTRIDATKILSMYDRNRRWIDSGTLPDGVKRRAFLQAAVDAGERLVEDLRPAFYRWGTSGELRATPAPTGGK